MRAEAEAVYRVAGITIDNVDVDSPRRADMQSTPISGIDRVGTSSVQSLIRGTGSIETDYFNGEIVLLGRLHRVPTPVNLAFSKVSRLMVRDAIAPGSFCEADIEKLVNEPLK
jgi:2-dehydropantoate 2-reductase